MILDWNHNNTRFATFYLDVKFVAPKFNLPTSFKEEKSLEKVHSSLDFMENRLLKENEYLASNGHPTVADLQAYFDLHMLVLLKVILTDEKY